jgi:hypothetical protein
MLGGGKGFLGRRSEVLVLPKAGWRNVLLKALILEWDKLLPNREQEGCVLASN